MEGCLGQDALQSLETSSLYFVECHWLISLQKHSKVHSQAQKGHLPSKRAYKYMCSKLRHTSSIHAQRVCLLFNRFAGCFRPLLTSSTHLSYGNMGHKGRLFYTLLFCFSWWCVACTHTRQVKVLILKVYEYLANSTAKSWVWHGNCTISLCAPSIHVSVPLLLLTLFIYRVWRDGGIKRLFAGVDEEALKMMAQWC